ncbi:MAG: lysine N(6)-hydroxylase/L-ornithine N(5)-oxygenase family protein [Gemmatimonadetes bacterium]|nr:lysine N(6)-hydroxylase/L-ornithine N(5)-oxygenase family protein [Gemmatimonadota bacterium]
MTSSLPVAIIGAGPVGLAAAAHLHARGESFVILEQGDSAGAAVKAWSQVGMFSPWKFVIDRASEALLRETGWRRPPDESFPTGGDLAERYLIPLAAHPAIAPSLRLGCRVIHITKQGFDRMTTPGRTLAPFAIRAITADGETEILARAVIDASGTWSQPNPAGASGVPAVGESAAADRIASGIPDLSGRDRARYAGRRVAVVGSGHSAFNVLLDLVRLAEQDPATSITWIVRKRDVRQLFGGGEKDQLAERGKLGLRVQALLDRGRVRIATGFGIDRIGRRSDGIHLHAAERTVGPVDEVIVTTGFRPNLAMLSELRLNLDPITEAPVALAPLIDPNVHSCGTVPPHGAKELRHDEDGFFVVGMKAYGRAPTFLLLTGYEQARSVVAWLAGDRIGAERVELVLPETGVCSSDAGDACCGPAPAAIAAEPEAACCGGPAPAGTDACCADDARAKSDGDAGCGCGSDQPIGVSIGARSK